MALRYYDNNGATAGFGTLSGTWSGSSPWTTSTTGTTTPGVYTFLSGDTAQFGFGTTTCTAGTFTIANGVTITLSKIVTAGTQLTTRQTIAATGTGRITLAGAGAGFESGTTGGLTISSPVGGTAGLAFTGGNTLTLTGTNNYSGTTSISTGVLEIGNASAFGTSTVSMTGGKLSSSSTTDYFVSNAFSVSGTVSFLDATKTGYIATSGAFNIAAPATMTLNAAQQLYVSGALNSTNSAATLALSGVSGSTYRFVGALGTFNSQVTLNANVNVNLSEYTTGTPNQFNNASIVDLKNGSNIQLLGNITNTFTNTFTGEAGAVIYNRNASASGLIYTGTMSGYAGSLRIYADSTEGANPVQKVTLTQASQFAFASFWFQNGGGLTTLSQTLSYTGTTVVSHNKPFIFYSAGAIPVTAVYANNSTNGSSLTNTNAFECNFFNGGTPTLRLEVTGGPITMSGAIYNLNGMLNLSKTGSNTVTLSGANSFTGSVSVSAGTLNANSATALGASNSTAAISVASGTTLSLGAALNYSSPGRSTSISGTGVSGVDAGCLVLANAGPLNLGAINATNNTYIRGTTTTQLTSAIAWSGSGGLRLGAATGTTATFSGAISVSSGTLTAILFGRSNNPDLGTVVLGTTNTFTAPAQIDFGTLQISADNNLGTPPSVYTAGYLIIGNGTTLATTASFTLNPSRGIAVGPSSASGTGIIDVASGTTLTISGFIDDNGAGTGILGKTGTGTLFLLANNAYAGGTNIVAGTVRTVAASSLGTGGVSLTSGGSLWVSRDSFFGITRLTVASLDNGQGCTIKIS